MNVRPATPAESSARCRRRRTRRRSPRRAAPDFPLRRHRPRRTSPALLAQPSTRLRQRGFAKSRRAISAAVEIVAPLSHARPPCVKRCRFTRPGPLRTCSTSARPNRSRSMRTSSNSRSVRGGEVGMTALRRDRHAGGRSTRCRYAWPRPVPAAMTAALPVALPVRLAAVTQLVVVEHRDAVGHRLEIVEQAHARRVKVPADLRRS